HVQRGPVHAGLTARDDLCKSSDHHPSSSSRDILPRFYRTAAGLLTRWRRFAFIRSMEIDLNCDLGEGCPHDAELMPLITSATVAGRFHAGDPATAHAALTAAARHGVQVGAHPGFPDREHFGRRELERGEQQVFEDCVYQIGALAGLARAAGLSLCY